MSSSGDDLKHFLKIQDMIPDYCLIEPEIYKEAANPLYMNLFKLWRQGRIMQDVYRRRSYFYRPPNWLLIFSLGPTSQVRAYMNKTLKTMLRIHEDRMSRRR